MGARRGRPPRAHPAGPFDSRRRLRLARNDARRPQRTHHHAHWRRTPEHQRGAAQETRPLHQLSPGAHAARAQDALPGSGARSRHLPRKHRGSLLRPGARSRARRGGEPEDHHAQGLHQDRALGLRMVAPREPQEGGGHPQGQHHEVERRPVPQMLPRNRVPLPRDRVQRDDRKKDGFELVVLRPGVIYGPGGGHFSTRVGLQIGPFFFHMGPGNLLPLSFVVNCAEAIVIAGTHPDAVNQVYNVHDDDLPTASRYLRQYKKQVRRLRTIRLPYFMTRMLARLLEIYHRRSLGQLPAILTRYKVAAAWGGNRFTNAKLRSLGWRQLVSTPEALARTFEYRSEEHTS